MSSYFLLRTSWPYTSVLSALLILLSLSGCGNLIASQTAKVADSISASLLDNDDPQTVADALPTFIVLSDSMARDSDHVGTLLSAARLNSAFAGTFLSSGDRQKRLANKGYAYAVRAACLYNEDLCSLESAAFNKLQDISTSWTTGDVPVLYALAGSWLTQIQANSDNWQSVASLPKVKLLLESVVTLQEDYDYGGAHLYLGGIATLLPPSLGGKPDVGKQHFDRAIQLSEGKHLLIKVEYARRYARLIFDQTLHHQLLNEVLASDIKFEGLTLLNAIAQQQARQLLEEEADYF